MELGHLKYFHEVAEYRSFTKAAKALQIAQSAVSKGVKNLEAELGVALFERTKRRVDLTPLGERFFERSRVVFGELASLEALASSFQKDCAGNLHIGASDNLCNYLFPKLLGGFLDAYPKVEVKIFSGFSSAIKNEIQEGRSEIGLFYTPLSAAEKLVFEAEDLGLVQFALVVGRHSKQVSRGFRADDFRAMPFIGSISREYEAQYPALRMLQSLGVIPASVIETNNQETQKRLVAANCGFSLIPRPMILDDLKAGKLREIKLNGKQGEHLLLVKKRHRVHSRAAAEFRNNVILELQKSGWITE